MQKDNKKRLFEVFQKVNKVNLKEWYDDDYGKQPSKIPNGIGSFNNIDWQVLHEQFLVNAELLAAGKTSDGNLMIANVSDLTDNYEGMLSKEELNQLVAFDLISINNGIPVIDNEQYRDYNEFRIKAQEIWNKEQPQTRERGMVDDAPYLRGREEQQD